MIFCFFLDDCFGRWSQWMWLVSCRRQGMLTQGPAPDPKCRLNITSFLTFPHTLHCLICAKDIMSTVLLLQEIEGQESWGRGLIYVRVLVGEQGFDFILSLFFCLVFVLLLTVLSLLVHDSLLCLLHCFFFAFFVSDPFNQALLVHRNCCVCFVKLFKNSGF